MRDVAYDPEFTYASELGRRYAEYCVLADTATIGADSITLDLIKPQVGYSAGQGFQLKSVGSGDITDYIYAHTRRHGGGAGEEQLSNVLNAPNFQSFLAREFQYSQRDLGANFPIEYIAEFLLSCSPNKYKKTLTTLQLVPEHVRPDLTEAFLATEFGDDFGDAILDIAEHVSPEKTAQICELVNSLRSKSHEFAGIFVSIDPALAEQTEKALSERITDALVSVREVAVDGFLKENVSPARNTPGQEPSRDFNIEVHSVDEAVDILASLEKTFATQQAIIQADDLRINRVNDDTSQFTLYRFVSETAGNMLLYIRPEGAYGYDSKVEYGNRAGVEASISFVVNPLDPHALLVPKSSEGVSIRLDREGRVVGEAPNSPDRDPTREDGMTSIDVSSIMGPETSLSVRIGRFIAAGNLIRSRTKGTADSLHHNSNYFDQTKYGSAKGFAGLAKGMIEQVNMLRLRMGIGKLSAYAIAKAA